MTDPSPDPLPTPQPPGSPEPDRPTAAKPAADDVAVRYAVYDLDLLRFVGPVHQKRPTAKTVKDLVGDHRSEVREV